MTDLILSVPRYFSDERKVMDLETLERSLKIVSSVKRNALYLHADWSVSSVELVDSLTEVKNTDVTVTYCIDSSEQLEDPLVVLPEDANIEVSLSEGSSLEGLQALKKYEKISFFLPLERHDSKVEELLERALEIYPSPVRIGIGVGWENRLSGPELLDDEQHQNWAESLLSLTKMISKQKIKISFYCGLKLCLFDKLQLGELAVRNLTWPIATCPRPFLFAVNGDISPCVRLLLPHSIDQEHIGDLDDTADAVNQWLAPFLGLCYDSETFDCRSLKVASCSTGCVEHSLEGWQS